MEVLAGDVYSSTSKNMTVGEAFDLCEEMSTRLLNFSLEKVQSGKVFPDDVIETLRSAADAVEKFRKKKNVGVIGGSATSIVGGALAITGAILLPFSFGLSTGLVVSGLVVGVVGGSVSVGFSLGKFFHDKKRKNRVKPPLNTFVFFQKTLALSVVNVQLVQEIITDITENFKDLLRMKVDDESHESVMELQKAIGKHDLIQQQETSITIIIEEISAFAEKLAGCLVHLLKPYREIICEIEDGRPWYEQRFNTVGQLPFDGLIAAVNSLKILENEKNTFGVFAMKYYKQNNDPSTAGTFLPARATMDAAGNLCGRGGAAGATVARVALIAADVGDDVSKVGKNVLRIAKGVSAAGVVLSVVGIAIDVLFLGHAVYDLLKTDLEVFSQSLISVADLMEEINNVQDSND